MLSKHYSLIILAFTLVTLASCQRKSKNESSSEQASGNTESTSNSAGNPADLALIAAATYLETLSETLRPVDDQVTFEFALTEHQDLAQITIRDEETSNTSDNLNLQLDTAGNLTLPASFFSHNNFYTLIFAYDDSQGTRQESSKQFRFKLAFGDQLMMIVDPLSATKNIYYTDIVVNENLGTVSLSGVGTNISGTLSGLDIVLAKFTSTGATMSDAWATPVIRDANIDFAYSLVEGSDGTVYFGGTNLYTFEVLRGYDTGKNMVYDGNQGGNNVMVWGMASHGDFLYAAATETDGGGAGNGADFHIRKIDMANKSEITSGNWPVYFHSAATGVAKDDYAYGVFADDSGVYVTGRLSAGDGANDKLTLLKFDSDGNFQWQTDLTSSNLAFLTEISTWMPVTANNTHVFVGFEEEHLVAADSDGDYRIKKIAKSNGMVDTDFDYIGGAALDDVFGDIAWHDQSQSLAVLTTGQNIVGGSSFLDWRIQTFNAVGELQSALSKVLDFGEGNDRAYSLHIDSQGDIWICGSATNYAGAASGTDAIVVKVSGY